MASEALALSAALSPPWVSSSPCRAGLRLVAAGGDTAARPIFWTIPTRFLVGAGAAGGLPFINTIGSAGGFTGPDMVGWLRDSTGFFSAGYCAMAAIMALTALLAFALRWYIREE
ncbi:MAG TPA: hypothetical protein VLX85_16785 [Stellaceae bacterium]|nr:hypothetical protein [Stellaceae bacterium]